MGKSFDHTIMFVKKCAEEIEAEADKSIKNEENRMYFKRGMKTMLSRILSYCSLRHNDRYRALAEIKEREKE